MKPFAYISEQLRNNRRIACCPHLWEVVRETQSMGYDVMEIDIWAVYMGDEGHSQEVLVNPDLYSTCEKFHVPTDSLLARTFGSDATDNMTLESRQWLSKDIYDLELD